jgi:hypothetical protein
MVVLGTVCGLDAVSVFQVRIDDHVSTPGICGDPGFDRFCRG